MIPTQLSSFKQNWILFFFHMICSPARGMIAASGPRGRGFNSRQAPIKENLFKIYFNASIAQLVERIEMWVRLPLEALFVVRPNHGGVTRSHSNSEVKHHWACLVLRWGTTRESYVLNANLACSTGAFGVYSRLSSARLGKCYHFFCCKLWVAFSSKK